MGSQYVTAFAHMVSAGASVWAMNALKDTSFDWVKFGTLPLLFLNSVFGAIIYAREKYGGILDMLHNLTEGSSLCLGVPCVATQLYLNYGFIKEVSFIHLGAGMLPLVLYITRNRGDRVLLDIIVLGNLTSICYVSAVHQNYYGFAMAACYAFNYTVIGTSGTFLDFPSVDFFMYGLCFFDYFLVKTLSD